MEFLGLMVLIITIVLSYKSAQLVKRLNLTIPKGVCLISLNFIPLIVGYWLVGLFK